MEKCASFHIDSIDGIFLLFEILVLSSPIYFIHLFKILVIIIYAKINNSHQDSPREETHIQTDRQRDRKNERKRERIIFHKMIFEICSKNNTKNIDSYIQIHLNRDEAFTDCFYLSNPIRLSGFFSLLLFHTVSESSRKKVL